MNLLCGFGRHKPAPSKLWNDGHFFSTCLRCRTPLIRKPDENWHAVPPGMKVVWRKRTDDDIVWPTHII